MSFITDSDEILDASSDLDGDDIALLDPEDSQKLESINFKKPLSSSPWARIALVAPPFFLLGWAMISFSGGTQPAARTNPSTDPTEQNKQDLLSVEKAKQGEYEAKIALQTQQNEALRLQKAKIKDTSSKSPSPPARFANPPVNKSTSAIAKPGRALPVNSTTVLPAKESQAQGSSYFPITPQSYPVLPLTRSKNVRVRDKGRPVRSNYIRPKVRKVAPSPPIPSYQPELQSDAYYPRTSNGQKIEASQATETGFRKSERSNPDSKLEIKVSDLPPKTAIINAGLNSEEQQSDEQPLNQNDVSLPNAPIEPPTPTDPNAPIEPPTPTDPNAPIEPSTPTDPYQMWLAAANAGTSVTVEAEPFASATSATVEAEPSSANPTGSLPQQPNYAEATYTVEAEPSSANPTGSLPQQPNYAEATYIGDRSDPYAPQILIGSKALGELETPIFWGSGVNARASATIVRLKEDLLLNGGGIAIAKGSYLIGNISAASDLGFVQIEISQIMTEEGGIWVTRNVPSGSLVLLTEDGNPLKAKKIGGNKSGISFKSALLSGIARSADALNLPTSQTTISGTNFSSSVSNQNPNVLAAGLGGIAGNILSQENSKIEQEIRNNTGVAYAVQKGSQVMVFVNRSFVWNLER